MSLRNRFFSQFKKKIKSSLWKKISKKNRRKSNLLTYNDLSTQENLYTQRLDSNNNAIIPFSLVPPQTATDSVENFFKLTYVNLVYLNILSLHYETRNVDCCIQSIRKNPILTHLFQLSYNEFRAKFYSLMVIGADKGENFSLALNRPTELLSLLTYLIRFLFPPLAILGGLIRMGINELNRKIKSRESKNGLKHCITNENFTKIASLLFSIILVKNLSDEKDLGFFVKKNFLIFWEILQEHAELFLKKTDFSGNSIEKLWAYCFCLFELTVFCNSLNTSNKLQIDNKSVFPTHQGSFNEKQVISHFFDTKKWPKLPIVQNKIGQFWKNKINMPILENSKHLSELVID